MIAVSRIRAKIDAAAKQKDVDEDFAKNSDTKNRCC